MTKVNKVPFGLRCARLGFFKSKEPIRVGAALVCKGLIIVGYNQAKSAPIVKQYNYHNGCGIHAEASLFAHLDKQPKNVVCYVYRQLKNGRLALARPCAPCMEILRDNRVRKVVYTIDNSWVTERI